jgi:hypothetical protein
MRVSLSQSVRIAQTGETTTIAALAAQGRIRFTTCLMDTKKRAGERRTVRRYFADLVDPNAQPGVSSGWEISETAYKSRTGQAVTFGEG